MNARTTTQTAPLVVPDKVKASPFGCRNCLWISCECTNGSKYIPVPPYNGTPTCGAYTCYD